MTFKPAIWYPIAALLSVGNLAAVWFAAGPAEPLHATIHAAFALAFGLWAQRLRLGRRGGELWAQIEPLELEVSQMQQQLSEAQERLDFAERLLAQGRDPRRAGTED